MKFKPNPKAGATMSLLLLFFSFLIFSSCKKDDDPIGTDTGSGTLTMKIDGVSWESKDAINGAVALESLGSLQITAQADDGSQISFGLTTPNQGSTWDFMSGGSAVYKLDVNDTNAWTASGGIGDFSITFNTYNESKAKGTFGGTLVQFDTIGNTNEIVISDASFDLNF